MATRSTGGSGGLLGPRKSIDEAIATTDEEGYRLRRDLSAFDVVTLGIGVIIGAGIFVVTGQEAANTAGPAVALSFVIAGVVCALAALCYGELAAMVPVAGSAYTYTFATVGQFVAFVIGWDLFLEFTIGASAVAVGFAGYLNSLLDQLFGSTLPDAITAPPGDGGTINVFAILIVVLVGFLLVRGVRVTAKANIAMVVLIIAVLLIVIAAGATQIDTGNWTPFSPFGFDGIEAAAAVVFFAYIGFDVVATTAEETRNPQRDMPIGILGSLAVVTVLYVAVSLVITGMAPYKDLATDAPVADVFRSTGQDWVSAFVYAGALVATFNTVLILVLGQSRVLFAMCRDALLPRRLATTHPTHGTPHQITWIITGVVALMAGLVPLSTLVNLVSIGTLFAFALVSIAVLYLRRTDPDRPRRFRTPLVPVVPVLSVLGTIYLATKLDGDTWLRFVVWMLIGFVIYFTYSRRASVIGRRRRASAG
jgi:basic amino acid/polyamine antiporter, APA family